jgi:hypothetical protein
MRFSAGTVFLAAYLWLPGSAAQSADPPLTVCELLKDRVKYNGKMVVVRGEVDSTSEGGWLIDESCAEPLEISGLTLGRDIALVSTVSAVTPVNFKYDLQAEERLQREFKKLKVKPGQVHIFVTYEGVFETRPDSELTCGDIRVCGFGHLGGSPAQLVVKTERDLTVTPRQRKK